MPSKITSGVGGRGTAMSIERQEHPKSHYEIGEMRIKKADDGSFVVHHEMKLKKRHENKEGYYGGDYQRGQMHTAQTPEELMQHVKKHFGGKKAATEAETPEEEMAEGGEEET